MNEDLTASYIHIREAKRLLGVSSQTLHNWERQGKIRASRLPSGTRTFHKQDVYTLAGVSEPVKAKEKICYCRVSSKKQMEDLERQKDLLQSRFPSHLLVTDVGSGINWKRKGLQTLLERSLSGELEEVVVAHPDRLCRFAFELLQFIFETCGVQLLVLDREDGKSSEQELAEDILSILHVYSCKQMGKRRYSKPKDTALPDSESEKDS